MEKNSGKKPENKKQKPKRKVKKTARPKTRKNKKFISPKLAAILKLLGAAGLVMIGNKVIDTIKGFPNEKIQIAVARDIEGDEFENSVPIYENGELVGTINDQQLVIIDYEENVGEDLYAVMALNDEGTMISGVIGEEYVDLSHGIKLNKNDERLKYSYEVEGTDFVNVRNSTVFDSSTKIGMLQRGDTVLGGGKVVSKDNDFMWIPVLYFDEEGNIKDAYICQDYLRMIDEVTLEEESLPAHKMIVNTERHNGVSLNLRSDTELDNSNIITKIPNGSIVTTKGVPDERVGSYRWANISYTDEEGKTHEGWVVKGFLEEIELIKMKVDTSRDGGINLNVRKGPSINADKVAGIENGTIIEIPKEFIDNAVRDEQANIDWIRVQLNDGTQGYVAASYLKKERERTSKENEVDVEGVISQDELEDIFDNISVRSTGNVVGIDTTSYSPEQLKDILKSKDAIPSTVYYWGESEYDTADLAGKADFVMIKVGARGWGKAGNMVDEDNQYKEYAKVCEELKVPYGFYFYSTALTKEEADEEITYCKNAINSLESTKYNLLPLTADFETHIKRDEDGNIIEQSRLIGHDITEVAAYWANEAEPYFGKIMIYTAARNMTPSNYEYIINLHELNKKILSGKPKFWIPGLRFPKDYTSIQGHEYLDPLKKDMDIVMIQTILDSNNKGTGLPRTDIDIVKEEDFIQLLKDRRSELIHDYTDINLRRIGNLTNQQDTKHNDRII